MLLDVHILEMGQDLAPGDTSPCRHWSKLQMLVHPGDVLEREGYTIRQLSPEALKAKQKCSRCFLRYKAIPPHHLSVKVDDGYETVLDVIEIKDENAEIKNGDEDLSEDGTSSGDEEGLDESESENGDEHDAGNEGEREDANDDGSETATEFGNEIEPNWRAPDGTLRHSLKRPRPDGVCAYHPGSRVHGVWTCCGGHTPCKGKPTHSSKHAFTDAKLAEHWKFFPTLGPTGHSARKAVVLGCGIGQSMKREPEPISLALLDYFSGEVLINKLVWPDAPMVHYNTAQTGIWYGELAKARRDGAALRGRSKARRAMYEFVGPDTVVVGHALHHYLRALRLLHSRVVDTEIVGRELTLWRRAGRTDVTGHPDKPSRPFVEEAAYRPFPDLETKTGVFDVHSSLKRLAVECFGKHPDIQGVLEYVRAVRDVLRWHIEYALPIRDACVSQIAALAA